MSEIKTAGIAIENPFPGLRPYDINESQLFFGREHQVNELLRKLSLYHFVSVVGTSGSGKSSLVRAGLLAKLYNGYDAEKGSEWTIAVMRPGAKPVLNLAEALFGNNIFGNNTNNKKAVDEAYEMLTQSPLGLIQIVRANITRGSNLLLLVDQFEELFRFAGFESEEGAQMEADHFVKLLIEAVRQQDAGIYVVMTLRADFLGDCSAFEGLPEAINNGQYLIPRLNREHYKAAIEGPVNIANGKIAPRLVQQLLNDMSNNQDQLPILQHALMRSWENWKEAIDKGEPMDLNNYRAVGGMEQALNLHANEAYEELDDKKKKIAELIFKCVTVKGLDNRGIRRPTKLQDICLITQTNQSEVIKVLSVFRKSGRGFIMPPEGVDVQPDTVIDISHESLMRNWERLKDWVDEEYDSAQMYIRISEGAMLYQNGVAGLWRDPELSVALEWKEKNHPHKAWSTQYNDNFEKSMKFLDASIEGKEKMLAEKKFRRLVTNVIAIVFLLCAGGLTLWATIERGTASKSAKEALKEKSNAEKQEKFAIEKEGEAEKNFQTEEFQRKKAEEQTQEAEKQRLEAIKQKAIANIKTNETLKQTKMAKLSQQKAEDALKIAENEKLVALVQKRKADSLGNVANSEKNNADQQRKYAVARSLAVKSLNYDKNNEDSVLKGLLALQAYKLNIDNRNDSFNNDIIRALYEANKAFTSRTENILTAHTGEVKALAASLDGKYIASAGNDGKVILWTLGDVKSVPFILKDGKNDFSAVAFSPDSKWLAASTQNSINLWKLGGPDFKPIEISGHRNKITSLVFSNDYIISGGLDSNVMITKLQGKTSKSISLDARVLALAYGSKKNKIAIGTDDGGVYTLNLNDLDKTPELLIKNSSQVTSLSFNSAGTLIAAGYDDGSLNVYYSTFQKPQLEEKLGGHKSTISAVVFGKGNQLASAGFDTKVKLWRCFSSNPPVEFNEHEKWVMSMAMNPNGKRLYSGGRDKTIRIYDIDQNEMVERLRKKVTRNFTRKEWAYYMGDDTPYQKVVESLP